MKIRQARSASYQACRDELPGSAFDSPKTDRAIHLTSELLCTKNIYRPGTSLFLRIKYNIDNSRSLYSLRNFNHTSLHLSGLPEWIREKTANPRLRSGSAPARLHLLVNVSVQELLHASQLPRKKLSRGDSLNERRNRLPPYNRRPNSEVSNKVLPISTMSYGNGIEAGVLRSQRSRTYGPITTGPRARSSSAFRQTRILHQAEETTNIHEKG